MERKLLLDGFVFLRKEVYIQNSSGSSICETVDAVPWKWVEAVLFSWPAC